VRAELRKVPVCHPLPCICVCMPDLCHYPASLNMCGMCDRVLSVQQSDNTGTDVAARASPGIQVGLGLNKREVAASVYDFQPSFCACTICTAGRRSPSDADTSRFAKIPRPSLMLWCIAVSKTVLDGLRTNIRLGPILMTIPRHFSSAPLPVELRRCSLSIPFHFIILSTPRSLGVCPQVSTGAAETNARDCSQGAVTLAAHTDAGTGGRADKMP
jgi:hypothetical protein